MIIEIAGVNRWNKGAELMMRAVRDKFAGYPSVSLAVDQRFGKYADRAMYGLLYHLEVEKFGRSKLALSLMPASLKRSVGLVSSSEIDAVLDASGFAFGDQHPVERTERFANRVERLRTMGKPVILLPQALGPFENPRIRKAFSKVVNNASHIFARDPVSLEYAQSCSPGATNITQAPDFTNLVEISGLKPRPTGKKACIVPNQRMIEKATDPEMAQAYIPLLCQCISYLKEKGVEAFLLIHGSHDAALIEPLQNQLGYSLETVRESDPVEIKRILGESFMVIGSRFHALVSALTQAVPSIATSWSHKYEMLFQDYGCPELVLPVVADKNSLEKAIDETIGNSREMLIAKLSEASASLKKDSLNMWSKVDELLGLKVSS